MECRKLCSYLVEIENKEEADWISKTFLEKGIFAVCKFIYGLLKQLWYTTLPLFCKDTVNVLKLEREFTQIRLSDKEGRYGI